MIRRYERIIGLVGATLVTILLGGFTVTINALKPQEYRRVLLPIFGKYLHGLTNREGLMMFRTLGAWFGYTVITVLILVFLTNVLLRSNKHVHLSGWLYLITGIVTLLGSQLIAYPLAFVFFVGAAMCFLRKVPGTVQAVNGK